MISSLVAATMRRPRHHTLIFHSVLPQPDPMRPTEPTADWFGRLMHMISSSFEMISLADALSRARQGRLSGRTVSVTFDDGYADNLIVALPILEKLKIPATFFVASGFVDGGRMWNDSIIETFRRAEAGTFEINATAGHSFELTDWTSRREAADATITAWKHLDPRERQARVDELSSCVSGLPSDLMLNKTQLQQLAQSEFATVGGHTRSHPILASIPDSEAAEEIEGGKRDLEDWIQQEVRHFAYPNGRFGRDYGSQHAALAKQAGFDAAVATDWGTLKTGYDYYAIPRFTPWQRNLSRFSIDLARCHFGLL